MTDIDNPGLLPEGLHDDLPPEAAREAQLIEALLEEFAAQGYQRVKPPLVEFEESLLSGPGAGLTRDMFRLMDPISQRMMGLRADITPQVARIARSRLAHLPRPLRLCYAGQVLRIRGTQLRPERQFAQAGAEMIGAPGQRAEAELVLLAADALLAVGIQNLSVDLTLPRLVPVVAEAAGLAAPEVAQACQALDQKNADGLRALPASCRQLLSDIMLAAGPADKVCADLQNFDLPAAANALVTQLTALVAILNDQAPDLEITVDAAESRGFSYQTGVSFTYFAKNVRGELGRGGRYALTENGTGAAAETAIGTTIYLDSVMRATAPLAPVKTLFLPLGTVRQQAIAFRQEGWHTLQGLSAVSDPMAEAKRLRCSHIFLDGDISALSE